MCKIVKTMYHKEGLYPMTYSSFVNQGNKEAIVAAEDTNVDVCAPFWDSLSCFPATPAGEDQVIPCMSETHTLHLGRLYKMEYDTTSML